MIMNTVNELLDILQDPQASPEQATSSLHELLYLIETLPITFHQRTRADLAAAALTRREVLPVDHSLLKLLTYRLSSCYLPGISELRLPPAPPSLPSRESSVGTTTTTTTSGNAPALPASSSMPSSVSRTSSLSSSIPEPAAATAPPPPPPPSSSTPTPTPLPPPAPPAPAPTTTDFLFQPLPPGVKMMCLVTRHSSTRMLKQSSPTYRLFIEHLITPDEATYSYMHTHTHTQENCALNPQWITQNIDTPGAAASPAAIAALIGDRSRCLLEAKKQKSGKGLFQVAVYACKTGTVCCQSNGGGGGSSGGEDGKAAWATPLLPPMLVGMMQSPSTGVLTATATTSNNTSTPTSTHTHMNSNTAEKDLVGSRLCVQVTTAEAKERVLSLGVVLPAPKQSNFDPHRPPEILEVPLAHLNALCSDSSLSSSASSSHPQTHTHTHTQILHHVCGLRNKPPRWNSTYNTYTLDFENNGRRVKEPSRKNLQLIDITHTHTHTHTHTDLGGRGGSGGGGGGGVRKGGSGGGGGGMSISADAASWASTGKPAVPLLQLGKVGNDVFSLDFRGPFSPFQALVCAVAVFEAP